MVSLRKTNFWDSARFGALIVQYDETDYVSDLHYTAEVYRALIVHYDETYDD